MSAIGFLRCVCGRQARRDMDGRDFSLRQEKMGVLWLCSTMKKQSEPETDTDKEHEEGISLQFHQVVPESVPRGAPPSCSVSHLP